MSRPVTRHTAVGAAAAMALAVPLIVWFEGDGGRVGYRDIVGVPTYCYGGTGPAAVVGKVYSAAQCQGQLATDVRRHAQAIAPCIHVAVPAASHAALISFAYNVGPAAFCRSTVARRLNVGDMAGACAGLSAWTYAGGKEVSGLVRRRAQERALCERGLA
jgi:lysozyme